LIVNCAEEEATVMTNNDTENFKHENERDLSQAKDLFKAEFERIKAEQVQRIGFRDNMIFIQFAAIGAVCSFVVTHIDNRWEPYAIILIPWICIILGWTYLVNDHAISQIGRYVRYIMNERIAHIAQLPPITTKKPNITVAEFFGWEEFHRMDARRVRRKWIQWMIDEFTFVLPGLLSVLAMVLMWFFKEPHTCGWILDTLIVVSTITTILLVALFYQIWAYADLGFGK
jgi:hypothetical protein